MTSMQSLDRPGEPRLAFRLESPAGASQGRVLMVHGYAEHSARYDHIVPLWLGRGLTVARFDLRGHGLSEGPRGHVERFSDYVKDLHALLRRLETEAAWKGACPPVLFGHSLGGLIAAHAAAELGSGLAGLCLTSPFFGVGRPISAIQLGLGKIVGRLVPGLRQPSGLEGRDMTHDAERIRAYDADPLGFHHVTVGWFLEVQRAHDAAPSVAPRLTQPFFCMAGGEDRVVSLPATRRFFDLVGSTDKELDVRDGLFHEILNELAYRDYAGTLADHMLSWTRA